MSELREKLDKMTEEQRKQFHDGVDAHADAVLNPEAAAKQSEADAVRAVQNMSDAEFREYRRNLPRGGN